MHSFSKDSEWMTSYGLLFVIKTPKKRGSSLLIGARVENKKKESCFFYLTVAI